MINYKTNEWIEVTQSVPEESGQYLVFLKVWNKTLEKFFSRIKIARFNRGGGHKKLHFYANHSFKVTDITHWMKLPNPPTSLRKDFELIDTLELNKCPQCGMMHGWVIKESKTGHILAKMTKCEKCFWDGCRNERIL